MRYKEYIDINCSANVLYRHLIDNQLIKDWTGGLTSIKSRGSKSRRIKLKQELTYKDIKGKIVVREHVLVLEKDKNVVLKWDQMDVTKTYDILTAADQMHCRLVVTAKVSFYPKFLNLIAFIIGGSIKAQWSNDLSQLKKNAENSSLN
jgi:activator of HSP90 ATPase